MKKIVTLLLLLIELSIYSQIQATYKINRFCTDNLPYIETYLKVYPVGLKLDSSKNKIGIEVLQIIKDLKNNIVDYRKYNIYQNIKTDSTIDNIIDLQRFQLSNNHYLIEVEIKDLFSNDSAQKHSEKFSLEFDKNEICFSDIELIDSYWQTNEISKITKSGYAIVPLVTDYFSPEFTKIAYYFEIYNSDKYFNNTAYILRESIKIKETGNIAGNFNRVKKLKANSITPILSSFNLENLPTGNYQLVTQIRDSNNLIVIENKLDFKRTNLRNDLNLTNLNAINFSNTFASRLKADSLTEYIRCLSPIASSFESTLIDYKTEKMSDSTKRQFFYSFWYNRNNTNPQKSWEDYKLKVQEVENMFATKIKRGYQTERGRIYLKYGPPNTITDRPNEPSAYPYQIWHYYKIGRFNNKRFIFYLPDLVTNDYEILHSDLQGEYFNNKWQTQLNKRNTSGGNIDEDGKTDGWGGNSSTFFRNP